MSSEFQRAIEEVLELFDLAGNSYTIDVVVNGEVVPALVPEETAEIIERLFEVVEDGDSGSDWNED